MRRQAKSPYVPMTSLENAVLETYGLGQNVVESLSSVIQKDLIILNIRLKPAYPPCPACGLEHPKIGNYISKTIKHSILQHSRCQIIYQARWYRYPVCRHTWYEDNPFVFRKQRISTATVR